MRQILWNGTVLRCRVTNVNWKFNRPEIWWNITKPRIQIAKIQFINVPKAIIAQAENNRSLSLSHSPCMRWQCTMTICRTAASFVIKYFGPIWRCIITSKSNKFFINIMNLNIFLKFHSSRWLHNTSLFNVRQASRWQFQVQDSSKISQSS